MFIMGGGYFPGTIPQALGALSVLLASVNVAGGFVITKRMLDMFKRGFSICSLVQNYSPMRSVGPTDPPEYNWLYSIPAAVFTGGFLLAAQTGFAGLVQAGYLASSILCIGRRHVFIDRNILKGFPLGSLTGLASQSTARQGNVLGMLGVGSGFLTSLAAVGFPPAVLAQFGMLIAAGGGIGSIIGRRITATELPQMVAG